MLSEKMSARFEQLAKERDIKTYDIALQCPDLSPQTVYNVVEGKTSTRVETLNTICEGMGITLRDFFDWDGEEHVTLSNNEKVIIEHYRRMDEKSRGRIEGFIKAIADENK